MRQFKADRKKDIERQISDLMQYSDRKGQGHRPVYEHGLSQMSPAPENILSSSYSIDCKDDKPRQSRAIIGKYSTLTKFFGALKSYVQSRSSLQRSIKKVSFDSQQQGDTDRDSGKVLVGQIGVNKRLQRSSSDNSMGIKKRTLN